MRPSDAQIRRYKQLVARYGELTAARLVLLWDRLGSYGDEDIVRYIRQSSSSLAAGKQAAVAASAAFFASALRTRPVGVRADDVAVEARIRDPFLAMRHAVAEGRPNIEALLAGRSMASAVGHNFVTSAARRTGDHVAKQSGRRVRWERVPSGNACDFCETVSGQTYYSADSADFGHDRCSCAVVATDESGEANIVTTTTARGEGRRALGIGSHHPRPGTHLNPRLG